MQRFQLGALNLIIVTDVNGYVYEMMSMLQQKTTNLLLESRNAHCKCDEAIRPGEYQPLRAANQF